MKLAVAAAAAAVLLSACQVVSSSRPIRILGASSLQDVLPALASAYEADGGTPIQPSFNGSSQLRVQIEQGASADLFLSADAHTVDLLVAAGLGDGAGAPVAANRLALVVPATTNEAAAVTDWTQLATAGVRIVAAADEVPIARYADRLVAELARAGGAPTGFADAYAANVVSHEDNVRAVLAKVEIGEADAAFVYTTDAAVSDAVHVLDLPAGTGVSTTYWGLVLADASAAEAARDFLTWLAEAEAQAILAEHGFASVP